MDPIQIPPNAPFFIVLNGGSGRRDKEETRRTIEAVFAEGGRRCEVLLIPKGESPEPVAKRAVDLARAQQGVVVAAGGDGTINAVAQATLGSGCPFAVIAQGTFNYFARTHGLPLETEDAARLLLVARGFPVQVGQVNGKVFLVNASLGLYPQLLQDREAYKQRLGRSRLVALWSAVVTVAKAHRHLRLRIAHREGGVDAERQLRTPTLFVGNNRLQMEQVGMPEAPLLEQGQLAAIALKPVGTWQMLWLMLRGAVGRLGDAETVESFASRHIVVRASQLYGARRFKVATDGEIVYMRSPLEFRVAPEPLFLLKPEPDLQTPPAAHTSRAQVQPA